MAEKGETNCCYVCCSTYCAYCMPFCMKCCPCCCFRSDTSHPKILYGSLNQQEDDVDGAFEENSRDLPSVIPVTKIFQCPPTYQELSPHPQIGDDEHGFKRPMINEQPRVRGISMSLQNDGFSFDPGDLEEDDNEEEDVDEEEVYDDDEQYTSGMSAQESSTSSRQYFDGEYISSDDSYSISATGPVSAKPRGSISFSHIQRTPEHTLERSIQRPLARSSELVNASMYRNVMEEINQRLRKDEIVPEVSDVPAVHFALYFDKKNKCITVHISKAVNLCTSFPVSSSNPFMIAYLLPIKSLIQQSPSVRATHDPLFNYVFKFFGVDDNTINQQVLIIKLYINDLNHFIGGVVLELQDADLFGTGIVKELCRFDEHCSMKESYQGDILVTLCFHSETRILEVLILEACNLRKKGTPGIPNPYIKVNLLYKGERIFKLKTSRTKERRTVNPVINERCEVLLSTLNTDIIQIDVLVMSYDRFGHNELIGSLSIGTQVQQISGRLHWKEAMKQKDKLISRWHAIYSTSVPQASPQSSGSLPKRLCQVSGMQI